MNIETTIREYLPQIVHMSLATSQSDRPWVCEVHFVYDQDLNLYYRSLTTRRHSQEIAANPHVAGNIIKQHAVGEFPLGVYFEGIATLVVDPADRKKLAPLFKERLQPPGDILADAANPDGHQFYKISVSDWYVFGKLEDDQGAQKHHLSWGTK
jgi:hypothetical protein